MPRTLTASALVSLPRLDAHAAIALAQSLDAASMDEKTGKRSKKLAPLAVEALDDIAADRESLQAEVGAQAAPAPKTGIKRADQREDAAIGAIHDLLAAWARLADELPEGDSAKNLHARIFGSEGLAITKLPVKEEWAVIDSKLKLIASEKLDAELETLGGKAMLTHLRKVHEEYGRAVGTTKPTEALESPAIRDKRDTLLDSIRTYAVRVISTIDRRRPETQTFADQLLKPLAEWQSAPVASPPKKNPKPPQDPPPPASP